MSDIQNVVLIGASGNLGPSVLAEFLKSTFTVTVLAREQSKATFPSAVKVVKTNYSPESLEEIFKNQDAVVSVVGSEGFADQTKIIDAAVKAGVQRFFPSEFGSDTKNDKVRSIVPIFDGKKQIVDYLKSKESGTFSWTALITGPFFDWGLKTGFLGFDAKKKTAAIWDSGNAPFTSTNLSQIGRALVNSLSPGAFAKTKNSYVYVASYTLSQNDLLKAFEKASGESWSLEHHNSNEVIATSLAKLNSGDYSVVYPLIKAAAFSDAALGDFTKVDGGLWNETLGLPTEDFEADIKAALI